MGRGLDLSGSEWGEVADVFKDWGNDPSGSFKFWKFIQ
jgi:hypothetical protein